MANIIAALKKYLYDDTGIFLSEPKRFNVTSLPYLILDQYDLYETQILRKKCVLLIAKAEQEISPATIKKHVELIRDKVGEDIVFIHPAMTSYHRKRLIEYKVPFVIPGNQMYLPDLMIDLREHFFSLRQSKSRFSPSTQAVILYILHHFYEQPFIPSELANYLGYSNTAMTRAFDEIEAAKIGQHESQGRQRLIWIQSDKRQFWKNVLPCLKTPVRRYMWLRALSEELRKYESGETALSRYSMLAPSRYQTFAVEKKDWDLCRQRDDIEVLQSKDEANVELQIWNYNPKLFASGETVDMFSLYLSLKDNNDERIQKALEEMMETIEW